MPEIRQDDQLKNPPVLTDEQRTAAAAKAIEARRRRSELKKDLKSGKISFEDIIVQKDDEAVSRLKVSEMIASLPGIGETKARRIMSELRINQRRRLRGLGNQQLKNLRAALGALNE